jgi:hypothetical protein
MQLTELSATALEDARRVVGDGPVVMLNLLWFRKQPLYPESFVDKKASARSAYDEGYASIFREIATKLGISIELVYAGKQLHGLLVGEHDDWDDMVIVRYNSLSDLQRIVERQDYRTCATPHRMAALANWRFTATGG